MLLRMYLGEDSQLSVPITLVSELFFKKRGILLKGNTVISYVINTNNFFIRIQKTTPVCAILPRGCSPSELQCGTAYM